MFIQAIAVFAATQLEDARKLASCSLERHIPCIGNPIVWLSVSDMLRQQTRTCPRISMNPRNGCVFQTRRGQWTFVFLKRFVPIFLYLHYLSDPVSHAKECSSPSFTFQRHPLAMLQAFVSFAASCRPFHPGNGLDMSETTPPAGRRGLDRPPG